MEEQKIKEVTWQQTKIRNAEEYQNKIFDSLNNQSYVSKKDKRITLTNGDEYTEFISCSYLGLDQDVRILTAASRNLERAGFSFSSARTRMKYSGLDELENLLNQVFMASTVCFSTVHLVHLGLIPLLGSGEIPGFKIRSAPHFILDKYVHASIQINRGLMTQFGNVSLVDFNEVDSLLKIIKSTSSEGNTPILICDSVGSMGSTANIKLLVELIKQYDGYLYLDDAHGMSTFGTHGNGYAMMVLEDVLDDRIILTTSLSKAFGTYGGLAIVKNPKAAEFIKKFCSTYIFSGSLATPLIEASIVSAKIHLSEEIYQLQDAVSDNLLLFDTIISPNIRIINRNSAVSIRGWYIGGEFEAITAGEYLKEHGILATVATYPSTPKHQSLIRFGICSNHTEAEIIKLCTLINLK
ncbi:aminotransferase class I/II-fold pyridoxal phosphate-dependent enzyme [Aquella oligotrophica]|uniref:Putative 8-amino-7-oxononanoate synthase n=1 Tax=Aquella oligotrophica TaxID=2067065 RepID=A0A2I7N609_9NEIS|nr:aminotransferase class I/II-fold pyridoxal phosphate-dependent enzyme [Aquella oligotrophica]AUR51872.1 aminotransferase [Aquella oligotrophica]